MLRTATVVILTSTISIGSTLQAQSVTTDEVKSSLRKAATFFRSLNKHGGYDWRYSRDLKLSEGEGETDADTIWVQPPGTPAVGTAFLAAYRATGDPFYLDAATEVADALLQGQLQSGGWYYSISFDQQKRTKIGYRDNASFRPKRRGRDQNNLTTIDDDTTSAVVRFLCRYDKATEFKYAKVREANEFALRALMDAQYPNGAWYPNWWTSPKPKSETDFPVKRATYPESWSRKWLNDWPGRYFINDDVAGAMIRTMYLAYETYRDERYLKSAKQGGQFLLLAQMPDPQPAWAQQYDPQMQPAWDRKFEPPAISSLESQYAVRALLFLAEKTGDKKWLEPIPKALAWLRKVKLPDGRLARFYELQTDRPLYFDKKYQLTFNAADMPTHYGFIRDDIDLTELESEYNRLQGRKPSPGRSTSPIEVNRVIGSLDNRGAWVDQRSMRGHRKASPEGVIQSETFIRNVDLLCRFMSEEEE